MLPLTSKHQGRIQEILRRGAFTSGSSRLRWEPVEPEPAALEAVLALFPDPDPARPFDAHLCEQAGLGTLLIPRELGHRKRLFEKQSFWDVLMELAGTPRYLDYSYRERADVYRAELSPPGRIALSSAVRLISHPRLAARIRDLEADCLDLYLPR
ncbi:MAG: hypothetical protein K2X35_22860 [Bryobacteraceae bacterium]|nr:hypothetical protein [Bryobacteraceae bacterium]